MGDAILSTMKAVSSSIIVLTGGIIYAAGTLNGHGDTQVATCAIGAFLGLFGLFGWIISMKHNE